MKLTGCTDSVAHNFFISHILFHQVCFFCLIFLPTLLELGTFIGTCGFSRGERECTGGSKTHARH